MKRISSFLLLFIALLTSFDAIAQEQEATYVFRNDNIFNSFACSEIDSITYAFVDGAAKQIVWTKDSVCDIPVTSIDSVTFETPKNVILEIPKDDLNDWDFGYSLGNEYIVGYTDSTENVLVTMINKNGGELEEGLMLCFDQEGNVVSVGNVNKIFDVQYSGDSIILYRINEDSVLVSKAIVVPQHSNSKGMRKAAGSVIQKVMDFIGYIQNANSIGNDFVNWDWWQLGKDVLSTGADYVIGKNPITGGIYTIGKFYVDSYRNQNYERQRATIYGDCTFEIDEIRNEQGSCVVYATLKGSNTMYDRLRNMYGEYANNVSCGILVRANNKYLTYHLHTAKSQEVSANGNGTIANLSFTIPEISLNKDYTTYYFRPFLKSSIAQINVITGETKKNCNEGYIKYGKTIPYKCFAGEIKDFNQYSAEYSTDLNNYGFVMFNTTVHASIESLDNIDEWGVYVYNLNNSGVYDYYPSEFKAAKLDDFIDIDFNINKSEFEEVNYQEYFASKKNTDWRISKVA